MSKTLGLVGAVVFAFGAMACDVSTEGSEGNVLFTPTDCGRIGGCDFRDSVGVGGVFTIQIQGIDGFSTAGVTLESGDPTLLSLAPIAAVGGRPAWEAQGQAAGPATVVAYDTTDSRVDLLDVDVRELTGLTLENFVGDAIGPLADDTFDEAWTVNADEPVSFYATPLVLEGEPTMGRYLYSVGVDPTMEAGMLEGANLDEGYIYFNVPAGEYIVTFTDDYDHVLDVRITAEAPLTP